MGLAIVLALLLLALAAVVTAVYFVCCGIGHFAHFVAVTARGMTHHTP